MRTIAILLAVSLAVPATGCVIDWTGRSGSYLLRSKVDVTREQARDLQNDLGTERQRIDAIDERAADARRRYADAGASVQALMEDLTYLRGEIADLSDTLQRTGQLTGDLEFQLMAVEARMGHIEGQLSTHIKDYEPAPILMGPDPEPIDEAPDDEVDHEPAGGPDHLDGNGDTAGDEPAPTDSVAVLEVPVEPVPVSESSQEELDFRAAVALVQDGSWKRAGSRLQDFAREYPSSEWWLEAQYLVGQCFFELGKHKGAITEFQKVIVRDEKSPWAARAMFMQGIAFEALGTDEDREAAEVFFAELVRLYPDSEEAAKARERLDALRSP